MSFSVPLTRLAHQYAQKSIQEERLQPKFKEIYLNYLAIYAVNSYLRCFEIEANLETQSSAIIKILSEQSYLEIQGKGKIECRPVLLNEQFCYVPVESWSDRIGYIAVRFNAELTEATLLGFLPIVNTERVSLEQFQPLQDVLDCLSDAKSKVLLSQWFKEAFTKGWQSLDELLRETESFLAHPSNNLAYQFRNRKNGEHQKRIEGVKVITFNSSDNQKSKLQNIDINFKNQSVLLLIAIAPETDDQISIQIRLYPSLEEKYLPANTHLELLSEQGQSLRVVISGQYDNWIQLPLIKASTNEIFNVQVSLDNLSIIETFTV